MEKRYFPGETICESEGYIKGHGTLIKANTIVSTYFGELVQVNKLLTVTPVFSHKHTPEVGDVIIGRVTEIYNKRWKLDANTKGETTLPLGSIILPGTVQRRKIESDEIEMRNMFAINDLVVAEVQKAAWGGGCTLHTRSEKYGKLTDGLLIKVPAMCLKPLKTRFIVKGELTVIAASNGFVWLSGSNKKAIIARLASKFISLAAKRVLFDAEHLVDQIMSEFTNKSDF